jgi:hypothetical protein
VRSAGTTSALTTIIIDAANGQEEGTARGHHWARGAAAAARSWITFFSVGLSSGERGRGGRESRGGGGHGGAAAGGLARPVGVHSAGVCSNPGCGHQVAKSGCKTCGVRLCGGASKQGFGCINAHLQGVKPSFTPRTRPLSGGVQVMILSSLGPVVS